MNAIPDRRNPVLLAAAALLAAALACSPLPGGEAPVDEPTVVQAEPTAAPEPTPLPTETPTPEPPEPAGVQVVSETGGYLIWLPESWEYELEDANIYSANMPIAALEAVDAPPPGVLVLFFSSMDDFGMLDEMTLFEILLTMVGEGGPMIPTGDPEATTVAGLPAAMVAIHTTDREIGDADGAVWVVERDDDAGILMILAAVAPGEWPGKAGEAEAILETLALFPPGTSPDTADLSIESPPPAGGTPAGFAWQVQRQMGAMDGAFGPLRDMAPGWDGLLYVADMEKGLWVVDPVTGAIRDLIPLEGVTPVDVAVGPDGETFYIADQAANAIAIFNITTRELIGQIGAGEFEPLMPGSVAVSWNGEVYASNGTAQVKIFGPDGALIGVVNMTDFADVTGPCPIAISPDGSIFAGCWGGEIVHLSATGESLGWVQAPELEAGGVTAITVALDMTVVLATSEGIVKVDPDTGEVLARYGGPTEGYPYCQGCLYAPYGLAAFLDGSIIYTDANQRAGAAIISAFFYP